MKQKILVTREVFDETIDFLKSHFEVEPNQADRLYARDELIAKLQGKDGVQTSSSDRIDAELLDKCPTIKAVCNTAVGYNNIDVDACTRHGVMVSNTPGVLTDSVADYSMGLIIATCRRMTEGEAYLRKGEWKGTYLKQMLGRDVHGATLGIMGFGRIGQAIARRARGFDMKILTDTPESHYAERGAMHILAEHLLKVCALPFALAQIGLAFGHAPAGGDDQAHRIVGHAVRQHTRCVADHDAVAGARVDVDVVVTHRCVAHCLDGGALVQQFGINAVAGRGLHTVLALQFRDQFIARVEAVGLVGLDFEVGFQGIDGFVENLAGDQDFLLLVVILFGFSLCRKQAQGITQPSRWARFSGP